ETEIAPDEERVRRVPNPLNGSHRSNDKEYVTMKKVSILIVSAMLIVGVGVFATQAFDELAGSPSAVALASPRLLAQGPGAALDKPPGERGGPWLHKRGFGHGRCRAWGGLMGRLKLTDEQREKMRNLYVQFRGKTHEARMSARSLRDEKKTMLMSGKIDQKKLAQLDEAILKSRNEVSKERLKLQRNRLALLTDDQVQRLADFSSGKQCCPILGFFSGHHGKGRFKRR
ncbi:MAG: Spy/CpxP family protein refolding chaperone, partial [Deltaproteobacteria bacterium]